MTYGKAMQDLKMSQSHQPKSLSTGVIQRSLYTADVWTLVIWVSQKNHCQFSEKIIVLWVSFLLQEDLFQQPGLRPEFEHIRDCLDTGMIDNLCILQKFVCACENMRAFKRERSISQSLASDSVTLANGLYLLRTFSERTLRLHAVSVAPDKQHGAFETWVGILALSRA